MDGERKNGWKIIRMGGRESGKMDGRLYGWEGERVERWMEDYTDGREREWKDGWMKRRRTGKRSEVVEKLKYLVFK